MNLLAAIDDPKLFAPWFKDRATWQAWFAFIAALFGYGLEGGQLALFRTCTGRETVPTVPFQEAWLVIGRRGGKSFVLALIAVFLACFGDYRQYLAPGERGTILVIAADRKQARVIMRFIHGLLFGVPMLRKLVEREAAEAFDLTNFVTIEVATASFRTTRGYTLIAALCDEIAFWRSEDSATPDEEVLTAIRPAMATIPGAILLCASSAYARRGAMWQAFQRYYARDDAKVLVWKAPTLVMNPTVPQAVIDEAYERDPASAAAEYGAEFRTDVETFISREAVMACVKPGLRERPPERQWRYHCFVDPSGGSSDSMTMAVSHKEGSTAILDLVREVKPPFSPEVVTEDFAKDARRYRITRVFGDRYAGEWVREQFNKHGLSYEAAERAKSDLYKDLLPTLNSNAVDLLDNDRLVLQLTALERRTARGGRDSIDHPPGGRDDVANAVAGAVVRAMAAPERRAGPSNIRVEGAAKYNPHTQTYGSTYARH